jgi:hypothetical protein
MAIPDDTKDRPSGPIPGKPPQREPPDRVGEFLIWFTCVLIWSVVAGIIAAGLYMLAWALFH